MKDLLPILSCRKCGGTFGFTEARRPPLGRAEFGVLACGCGKYPVVDGIPILIVQRPVSMFDHTTGTAQVTGITLARLVALIEQDRSEDALRECLALPVLPRWLTRLLGWRLSHSAPLQRLARWLGNRQIDGLLQRRDTISATELFDFFYRSDSPLDEVVGHYFNLRYGQPRHLAALALLQKVPAGPKPLLDIACGCGHLDHYLTNRPDPVAIVGTDLNFFHLWIARHWIAPRGSYVCADASEGLPFVDGSFSSVFCSDAYHYIPGRPALHREIERCVPGGLGILTRVGNAAVMPNEGHERDVAGYLEDIGAADAMAMSEAELLRCYLERRDPLAQGATAADELSRSKWLSFLWNVPSSMRSTGVDRSSWPHAVGTPALNPIYRRVAAADGEVELRFVFPSIWYAYENNAMMSYHPRRLRMASTRLAGLEAQSASQLAELVGQYVVLGLPARFLPRSR